MPVPLQIAFREMGASPAVEAQVRSKVAELEQFSDRIVACKVALEAIQRRQRQGKIYRVRIELVVPGGEIVVSQEPGLDHSHEDVYVTMRDAFDAARRQLQDRMRQMQATGGR